MVKREAERYGAKPVGSEIVGLIPKKAIEMAADFFLQLENFSPQQVFENRLQAALTGEALHSTKTRGRIASLAQPFLDAVAAPSATPGGGSVSALASALAAALGQMVADLSRKKKSQAGFADQLSEELGGLRRIAAELTGAIDRDAASYEAVLSAFKLPQSTAEERQDREHAIQSATQHAAEIPVEVAERSVALFERLGQLTAIAAASMKSDLEVARHMAAAGAQGALANVEINLEGITDTGFVATTRRRIEALRERLSETSRTITA
jgi:formiminotetrahydrofolate cyclodeaminase